MSDTGTTEDTASIQRAIDALATRNVEAFLVDGRQAALAKLQELVPEGSEVFVNTSETLATIGYTQYMHGNDRYVNLHDQMMAQPARRLSGNSGARPLQPTTSWAACRRLPRLERLSLPVAPAARSAPTPMVPAG